MENNTIIYLLVTSLSIGAALVELAKTLSLSDPTGYGQSLLRSGANPSLSIA